MGSVIESLRFLRRPREISGRLSRSKKIYLLIFATYFVAGFAFIAIGLQPVKDSAAVYAAETEAATSLLTIDDINLYAPVKTVVLNDKTLEVPEQIAGAYSIHENKTLIMGHSSTIFKDLKNTTTGMKIAITGNENTTSNKNNTITTKTYTITSIEEKQKQDIDMQEILKAEEKDTLILMTCSGEKIAGSASDHTHRLIITAKAD